MVSPPASPHKETDRWNHFVLAYFLCIISNLDDTIGILLSARKKSSNINGLYFGF